MMARRVRPALSLLGAAIGLLAAGCAAEKERGATASSRVAIGAPAPDYVATTLAGDSASLAAQRGRVVLLNVWATWCHPCRAEIPELREIHARYRDRGLELIGVSVDAEGSDDDIRAFMREFRMDYPIWRDPAERVATRFLMIGVPATFLIDREGVLRWRRTGPVTLADTSLVAAIERALANRS